MQETPLFLTMSSGEEEKTAASVVASLSGFKRDAEETHIVMSCDTAEETDVSISSRSTFNERTAKLPRFERNNTVDNAMIVPSQISSVPPELSTMVQSHNSHDQDIAEPESLISQYQRTNTQQSQASAQLSQPSQAQTTMSMSVQSEAPSPPSPKFGPHPPLPKEKDHKQPQKSQPANLQKRTLQLAPFFYYRDFSETIDEDPLIPLTPLARVPNFPAKMHSILSRPSLNDVVSWMPHGRSWRVLKPRDFEIRVIPTYFEHQKFSSFIRQANGWGFRRITQGRDRNSYYHELFLRGLPHLCKKMKRPGVNKKVTVDAEHEPEFYAISDMHPLPGGSSADVNLLLPSSLLGRNDWNQGRIPVGLNDMIGHSNPSYGAQASPGATANTVGSSIVNSPGQTYTQDAALKHQDSLSVQTQALASLSSLHERNHLYSQLQGLSKPDPTPRTNAASVLSSNPSSSRTHYPSLSILQQALRHQQQQAEGSSNNSAQAPAPSQKTTLAAIAAALNIPIHEPTNPRNSPPQSSSNQVANTVTNSLLQQPHKNTSSSSQIYALNHQANQQLQLAAIQRATSALQHAMSPAAASALGVQRRIPSTSPISNNSNPVGAQRGGDLHHNTNVAANNTNTKQGGTATLGDATSQFAAGFAAATALSNSQVRAAVNEALANHAQVAAANRQSQRGGSGALGGGGSGETSGGSGGVGIDGNGGGGGGAGQRREEGSGGGGSTRDQRFMYSPGNFYK